MSIFFPRKKEKMDGTEEATVRQQVGFLLTQGAPPASTAEESPIGDKEKALTQDLLQNIDKRSFNIGIIVGMIAVRDKMCAGCERGDEFSTSTFGSKMASKMYHKHGANDRAYTHCYAQEVNKIIESAKASIVEKGELAL